MGVEVIYAPDGVNMDIGFWRLCGDAGGGVSNAKDGGQED